MAAWRQVLTGIGIAPMRTKKAVGKRRVVEDEQTWSSRTPHPLERMTEAVDVGRVSP